MKKTISLLTIAIGLGTSLFAQEKKAGPVTPTKEARAAFEIKFPGAAKVTWEKEGSQFEVNFDQQGKEMSAIFDPGGQLVETETEIALAALPANASRYLKEHYAGKKIKEAAKIVKADGTVRYEAEVDKTDLLFDHNGTFIEKAKD